MMDCEKDGTCSYRAEIKRIVNAGLTSEQVCTFLVLLESANNLQLGAMKRVIEEIMQDRKVTE